MGAVESIAMGMGGRRQEVALLPRGAMEIHGVIILRLWVKVGVCCDKLSVFQAARETVPMLF